MACHQIAMKTKKMTPLRETEAKLSCAWWRLDWAPANRCDQERFASCTQHSRINWPATSFTDNSENVRQADWCRCGLPSDTRGNPHCHAHRWACFCFPTVVIRVVHSNSHVASFCTLVLKKHCSFIKMQMKCSEPLHSSHLAWLCQMNN